MKNVKIEFEKLETFSVQTRINKRVKMDQDKSIEMVNLFNSKLLSPYKFKHEDSIDDNLSRCIRVMNNYKKDTYSDKEYSQDKNNLEKIIEYFQNIRKILKINPLTVKSVDIKIKTNSDDSVVSYNVYIPLEYEKFDVIKSIIDVCFFYEVGFTVSVVIHSYYGDSTFMCPTII